MVAPGGLSGWWVRCAVMTDLDPDPVWPRTRYFGEPWDAPVTDDPSLHVPTPVGQLCLNCHMPVVEGEQGLVMLHIGLGDDGQPTRSMRPTHRECHLRGVFGALIGPGTHPHEHCDCESDPDPDGARWRHEGRTIVDWVARRRAR